MLISKKLSIVPHAWIIIRHSHTGRHSHMKFHASLGRWLVLIFFVKNKTLVCIVNYYSQFPIVKKPSLTADDLVEAAKIVFIQFGFPKKIISDTSMKFASEMFRQFCRWKNIKQAITLSYHQQSSSQM